MTSHLHSINVSLDQVLTVRLREAGHRGPVVPQKRLTHEQCFIHHGCRQPIQLWQRTQSLLAVSSCNTSALAGFKRGYQTIMLNSGKCQAALNTALPLILLIPAP